MNNGGGGIFDFLPIARHRDGYEELFGTPTGLDLAKVAALYGLHRRGVDVPRRARGALGRRAGRGRARPRRATWSCTARCSRRVAEATG